MKSDRDTTAGGFARWPNEHDEQGNPRKVGVEIEFGNLDVHATAEAVVRCLGGRLRTSGHQELKVVDSKLGTVRVELDSSFIKGRKSREYLEALGMPPESSLGTVVEEAVETAAVHLVPCEIVTDPIGLEELPLLETLREELRSLGALGTQAKPWFAFGVHFNPSLPSTRPDLLHAFLQAFCLLEDWIRSERDVNWSRRLTPYIDPFPDAYREAVLTGSNPSTLAEVIDTYLEHNPTRDRGLDMLPAWTHLDEARVRRCVDDTLVKSRPTFHYRLADCRVDDSNWRLAYEWEAWVEVEKLALDSPRRERLIERWRHRKPINPSL